MAAPALAYGDFARHDNTKQLACCCKAAITADGQICSNKAQWLQH